MRNVFLAALLLLTTQALAQYGLGNPNRTMTALGAQTTARGIIHYASGAPNTVITWRETKDTSAYMWCDTLTSRLYNWNHTANKWYSVGVFEANSTPPATTTNGPATIDNRQAFWFNTGNNTLYFYDRTGSAWATLGGGGGGSDNWGTQAVETDATLTGNGITGTELGIAQQGATSGQVLKWNGSTWAPAADNGGTATWGAISGTLSDQSDLQSALGAKANTSHTHAPSDITQAGATSGQTLKWNGSTWAPANDTDTDTDAQTLSFSEPNLSISGGNSVDLSDLTPTTEEIQDAAAGMVTGNTETRIAVTYDDPGGKINFVVEPNLSNYTNDAGFLTAEVDGSTTNEAWTISDGTNSEVISNQAVTFADGGIAATLYDPGTNTLTISATEIDGSTTNELQTLSYNATTDEITLSDGGGTIDITEVNTDAQTLSWNGSTGEVSISGGNSVDIDGRYLSTTLTDGQILVGNGSNVATEMAVSGDATITNAGVVTVDKIDNIQVAAAGASDGQVLKWSDSNTRWEPASDIGGGAGDDWGSQVVQHGATLTGNGTGGSPLGVATDGITSNEIAAGAVGTSEVTDNTLTATDLSVNVVSSLDGVTNDGGNIDLVQGGIVTITPDDGANTITISATEVDGSTSNEIQAITAGDGTGDNKTLDLSIGGGTVTMDPAGIFTLSRTGNTLTMTATEVDGSTTNEIQDLSLSSNTLSLTGDGTTVDLSGYLDNTDAQGLTITGSAAPFTLDISGGTDVNIDAGTGIALSETPANTLVITNSAPDQTVSITDGGGVAVSGTYPAFTVTATDQSISNEGSMTVGAGSGTTSIINSNTSGSTGVTITAGTGMSISETGNTITLANSGDTDAADDLTTGTSFSGDVSGAYNNLQIGTGVVGATELASTAVTPGSYTLASITVDADGRVTSAGNGTASGGHTIRDNGTGETQRAALNFISTSTVTAAVADDAGNDESEVTMSIPTDAITATEIAAGAVGTSEIANGSVEYADIQNVSATDKVLGRSTAGAGTIEEITMTAAGRALVDDASASDQRNTLGLGTIATQAASSVSITGGSITGITDLAVADGGTGASDATTARSNLGAAASGANTDITSVALNNTGLAIKDIDASHNLTITTGSNLTGAHTLTLSPGDADRTLTIGGNTTLSGGTHSGTNTGDQTITLTGDVTGSGTGSFSATVANDAVTYAKMQNIATGSIIGRSTASTGDPETITVSTGLSISGGNLTATDAAATNEGSLTVSAGGSNDSQIASNTSGSTNVTISGGSNVTITESGSTITIAAAGGSATDYAIVRGYIEGQTGTTFDLDALDGKTKDKDGTNLAFDVPTNTDNFRVYKNGIELNNTGTGTTRDYTVDASANSITLGSALVSTDRLVVYSVTGSALDLYTSGELTGNGTSGSPVKLAQQSATTGQALAWNGSAWAPATVGGGSPSVITPSQITSDQDNYNPTSFDGASLVRISSDAFRAITSLSAQSDGEEKTLLNVGSYPIYIPGQHPDGTAANRVITPYDYYIFPGKACHIVYDNTASRWNIISAKETYSKGVFYRWSAGSVTSGDIGAAIFTSSGTGATQSAVTSATASVPGTTTLGTGTTTTGACMLSISKSTTAPVWIGGSAISAYGTVSFNTLSDGTDTYSAGLQITASPTSATFAPNNTIGIRYSSGTNSGKWQGFSKDNSGAESTVDLGVTVATGTVYSLLIEVDKQNTEARFYVDGVMAGRVAANMPTAQAAGVREIIVKSAGTTARLLNMHSIGLDAIY